jgi:CHAT domain-containing protein
MMPVGTAATRWLRLARCQRRHQSRRNNQDERVSRGECWAPCALFAEYFGCYRRPGNAVSEASRSEWHAGGNTPALAPTTALLSGASEVLLPGTIKTALLTQSINRLLILPSADIGTVPYYALPVGGKQLIDLATIVVLSRTDELFVYADLREKVQERGSKLVIGNPDSSSDAGKWGDLPGAVLEAKAIDELTPSMRGDVLIGGEANKDKVLRFLTRGDASLIYFATHGYADTADPINGSFLLLSQRRLLAREVGQQIRLYKAPIVVMSACQSGLGKVFEGGMFGLARAWRNVGGITGCDELRDVDDLGTKRLMVEFMDKVLAGTRPEDALRDASIKARYEWGFRPECGRSLHCLA